MWLRFTCVVVVSFDVPMPISVGVVEIFLDIFEVAVRRKRTLLSVASAGLPGIARVSRQDMPSTSTDCGNTRWEAARKASKTMSMRWQTERGQERQPQRRHEGA